MNLFKKVWTPKSKQKSKYMVEETVILRSVVQLNDNCSSNWNVRQSKKISLDKKALLNDFALLLVKVNEHETLKDTKRKISTNFIGRKKTSVIISDLNTHCQKPINLFPFIELSTGFKSKCSRSQSVKSNMAAIKYKNLDCSSRRTRSAVSVYLLDHLMEPKRLEYLENMYGGKLIAHRSARIIQKSFRRYLSLKKENKYDLPILIEESSISKNNDDPVLEESFVDGTIKSGIIRSHSNYNPDDPFSIQDDEDRKRIYFIGQNLFNRNCNKGINFLIKHGILEPDGHSIVKFFTTQGLSSYAKGDFMSQDKNKLAIATRREFMAKMSFHNLSIESGVRRLFSKIRIPGETQKILNMLEEYHIVYLSQNENIRIQLKKEDTVVLISFAILMVHTSLHNPNAPKQDRMTKDQFVKIFKGINEEDFVSEAYLNELYDNVKKKQMKPLSDHTDLVRQVYSHLIGPLLPKDLIQNHRKLICQYNSNEIPNINKRPKSHSHTREIFLFNDLLLVAKPVHSNNEFQVRHVVPLLGLHYNPFTTQHYNFGLELIQSKPKISSIYLDCFSKNNRDKLVNDLITYIEEVRQFEVLLVEGEIERFNSKKIFKKSQSMY